MASVRTPKEKWVEEGMRSLASGGPDAVRVEPLARELGVTKGGFYWHFDNRRALLDEMLDSWERESLHDVIAQVDAGGGDGRERLRRLFEMAAARPDLLHADLAVRDWARRDKRVAARLRRVDNRRVEYMRSLFSQFIDDEDEVEARCLLVASLWFGSHFVAAEHGERTRPEVVALAWDRLLA